MSRITSCNALSGASRKASIRPSASPHRLHLAQVAARAERPAIAGQDDRIARSSAIACRIAARGLSSIAAKVRSALGAVHCDHDHVAGNLVINSFKPSFVQNQKPQLIYPCSVKCSLDIRRIPRHRILKQILPASGSPRGIPCTKRAADLWLERHLIVFSAIVANDLKSRSAHLPTAAALFSNGTLHTLRRHHVALVKKLPVLFRVKRKISLH